MRVFKKSSDKKQKTFLLSAPQPGSFKRGFHVDIGESGKLIVRSFHLQLYSYWSAGQKHTRCRSRFAAASWAGTNTVFPRFSKLWGLTTLSTLCLDIVISVDPNSATGFKGLPVEWEALVKSSCITKEEVIEHPRQVLEVSFLAGLLISLLTFSRPLNFKLQLLSLKM